MLQDNAKHTQTVRTDLLAFLPPIAAICYPVLLMFFHALIGAPGSHPTWSNIFIAEIVLASALGLPFTGILIAGRPALQPGVRRLAYATITAPALYVFLGVVQAMIHSPLPDLLVWCLLWGIVTVFAFASRGGSTGTARVKIAQWRIIHGISAAVLCLYILFHLANHLTGLFGPAAHAAVMEAGRKIYRAPVAEPILVFLFLFQIGTGLWLAWQWSSAAHNFYKIFQIASGLYLSVFLLGHMNSVFLYARTYLEIPTDWNFATGAPTGLIHDAWNIRLVPHYALGVFFVLGHLASGLRVVLIAHGARLKVINRLWTASIAASALLAAAIIAGMCGVRI